MAHVLWCLGTTSAPRFWASGRRDTRIALLLFAAALLPPEVTRAEDLTEVRVMFVGDTGTGDSRAREVRDAIENTVKTSGASHLFLLGDNVYEEGGADSIKPNFIDVYQPVMERHVRIHAALGNHDVDRCVGIARRPLPRDASAYVRSEPDRKLYSQRRRHVARARRARTPPSCPVAQHLATPEFGYRDGHRYYVVRIPHATSSLVDVFVLDSNTLGEQQTKLKENGTGTDEAQIEWLDGALATSSAHWKVIAMHHPDLQPDTLQTALPFEAEERRSSTTERTRGRPGQARGGCRLSGASTHVRPAAATRGRSVHRHRGGRQEAGPVPA